MLYISEICVRISIYSFQIFSFGQSKLYWQCKFINLLFSVQVLCAWFLFTFLFPDNQLSFRAKSCGQLFTAAIVSLWNRLHLTWPPQPINRVHEEGWKDNNAHPDKSPPSSRADKSPPRTICPFSPLMVSLSAIINPPSPHFHSPCLGADRRFYLQTGDTSNFLLISIKEKYIILYKNRIT